MNVIRGIAVALGLGAVAGAQQPMGSVATHDARVTGGLEVQGERASLLTNASVTAYDHTATIDLARGGQVLVCSTSQFHLFHSGTGNSLLFGLDRGSIEIHSRSESQDIILTPDIRFAMEHAGDFDLRMRVTPNGDTCVENAGAGAPVLLLADPFSTMTYRLIPGQHVMFEHGSLREVVDNERSPCGCPVAAPAVLAANATPAEKAAAAHPFPAAVSQGLVKPEPMQGAAPAPGETSLQASDTFVVGAGAKPAATPPPAAPAPASPAPQADSGPPPSPPGAHDIAHAIGHFFHKLFHPHESQKQTGQ